MGRVSCSSADLVRGISGGRQGGGGRRANWASIVGPLTAIQRSRLSFSCAQATRTNARQKLGPASAPQARSRISGSAPRKALQWRGCALEKASACHSRGLPARYPTAQKTSKATRPPGIPTPRASSARMRNGRWSSSSECSAGQPLELVVARRLWTFAPLDRALAVLTGAAPRLLARKQLREHVRPALLR